MLFKILFGLILLTNSFICIASTKEQSEDTIPFIIYKVQPINPQASRQPYMLVQQPLIAANVEVVSEVKHPLTRDVTSVIQHVRKAVCKQAGDANIRVWFSFDASGKILGIGAAAQSGLEVTFHCK